MTTGTGTDRAAATEAERLLYEARMSGDAQAVLGTLAGSRLYVGITRLDADTPGHTVPLPWRPGPVKGRRYVPVLTQGLLPPWDPELVFRQTTLAELARIWPDNKWWLGVGLGTPYETAVEARPKHRKTWLSAAERAGRPPSDVLVTHGGGALSGPLARGLALGAHLAVLNGLIWNQLGTVYEDYGSDIARMRSPWRVVNRATYSGVLSSLMAARLVGRTQEFVLRTRRALAIRLGRTPAPEEWTEEVTAALARRAADPSELAEAAEVMRRVRRYEDRFRADGVLAPGARVDTLVGFDLGRAVNVVRLALGARFCDPGEAERAVLRIGELAREAYGSWADFSLGYLLTRLIYFEEDEGSEEEFYRRSLGAHRLLTEDPTSPYRTLPWS
ncbi:hypothetical protein QR77_27795 [Streptomyces sp. 150FB]|nr:hypothetical protein QR77_27795 [Streptomyces sp. 150FB]